MAANEASRWWAMREVRHANDHSEPRCQHLVCLQCMDPVEYGEACCDCEEDR